MVSPPDEGISGEEAAPLRRLVSRVSPPEGESPAKSPDLCDWRTHRSRRDFFGLMNISILWVDWYLVLGSGLQGCGKCVSQCF